MTVRTPTLLVLALTCVLPCVSQAFDSFAPDSPDGSIPDLANGLLTAQPQLQAHRIPTGSIILDGRLDEAFWSQAELAGGFRQNSPDRLGEASVPTTFRVVYDDDAVYFGVACFEHDPSLTNSSLSRRDNIRNSDIVSIYIDPYLDRSTGYNFRINPHAVLADAYVFNDGNRDFDWDAVWDAAVHRDERGWFVEVRIPYSAIRYRPGDDRTWGLQVYRWMHGRGEDDGWVVWDRETNGFVSRFGTLTGLDGLVSPRQLEIAPYMVGRITDLATEGPDGFEGYRNFGADVRYGVTANMMLNATVQPDFGQVEADPSVLNLSPFETFFSEKRPFFVEGSRAFDHSAFNLFYSRRIGTGGENSRIRFASKLTGKTASNITVAALAAATDVTADGEAWNPFAAGERQSRYGVIRLGRESADGSRSIHVMQTAVVRDDHDWGDDDGERDHRNGYASGVDFDLNLFDRDWNVNGSFVRTQVDPHDNVVDAGLSPDTKVGTGGALRLSRQGGKLRGGLSGSWEHDRFDPNDAGRLSAPDEVTSSGWIQYNFDSDGEDRFLRSGNVHARLNKSWLYAGRTVMDPDDPDEVLWSYGTRRHQDFGGNFGVNLQTRSFWNFWGGVWRHGEGVSKYDTRTWDGERGPLVLRPGRQGMWLGFQTDWRNDFNASVDLNLSETDNGGRSTSLHTGMHWVQSDQVNHSLSLGFNDGVTANQWVDNVASDTGIGGVGYLFAQLDRRTWDLTWRSNVLFDRNRSLELYVQPFLTVGDYSDVRELAAPTSLDFHPYEAEGYDVRDRDFSYAAVNVNLVYRWEFRPGSTFFMVWTHSRSAYQERGEASVPGLFDNGFDTARLFDNEPSNVFLSKLTYWFSI